MNQPLKKTNSSNLTTEQKYFIVFMHKYLNYSIEEIKNHVSLKRENEKKVDPRTIKLWIKRYTETGSVDMIKPKGEF